MSANPAEDEDAELDAQIAYVERRVDEAMAEWGDGIPKSERGWFRDQLIDALMTHPNATQLLAQLVPRAAPDRSGEQSEAEPANEAEAARGAKK